MYFTSILFNMYDIEKSQISDEDVLFYLLIFFYDEYFVLKNLIILNFSSADVRVTVNTCIPK
jgi:hypothetical protein